VQNNIIIINGPNINLLGDRDKETYGTLNYEDLLIKKYKFPLSKIAIEKNNLIVEKKKIKKILLKNNDKIEVVHFIGGG